MNGLDSDKAPALGAAEVRNGLFRREAAQEGVDCCVDPVTDLVIARFIAQHHGVKLRQVSYFYKADRDYGTQLAQAIHLDVNEVAALAAKEMSH